MRDRKKATHKRRRDRNETPTGYWADIKEGYCDFPYDGPLPRYLYRFRGLDERTWESKLDQEINLREVFLAPLMNLNDPDEGRVHFRFSGSSEAINDFWVKKLSVGLPGLSKADVAAEALRRTNITISLNGGVPDDVTIPFRESFGSLGRVACFTTDRSNRNMWQNYATFRAKRRVHAYGGICIQYTTDESMRVLGLRKVTYTDDHPVIDLLTADEHLGQALWKLYFIKGNHWAVEDEWRVFSSFPPTALGRTDLNVFSQIRFHDGAISAIYVGAHAPPKLRRAIIKMTHGLSHRPTLLQQVFVGDDKVIGFGLISP